MRAMRILQRQIERDLASVHAARVRLVFAAVKTLLRSGRLSLTSLGRAMADRTSQKHGIKRADRMLGNPRLHREHVAFFRAIARRVVPAGSRPVVLVDWTAVTPKLWALVAAVTFEGRAIIVYGETHPITRYLKPYVNAAFLRRLADVLPRSSIPVIVADAGFRSPFMKLVRAYGWDYIVRLRGPAKVRITYGRGWIRIPLLFGLARTVPTDLGYVEVGGRIRHVCRLVTIRNRIHHRTHYCRVRRSTVVKREKRAAHQPWVLATSLTVAPEKIVTTYRRRMQIEETFRDAKSTRFGLSLKDARTSSDKRANVLLLLASLTHLFALVLGLAAESSDLRARFQANTVTGRRVLSLAMLGRMVATANLDALARSTWSALSVRFRQAVAF